MMIQYRVYELHSSAFNLSNPDPLNILMIL